MFAIGEVYLGYNRKVKACDAKLISTSKHYLYVITSGYTNAKYSNHAYSFEDLQNSRKINYR